MKEQEYINVSDCARVAAMLTIAGHIVPGNSKIIEAEEHQTVCSILANWQTKLFESINVEET